MRVLSLFSGGGLGDFGLELAGMEIIGQVEIDDYCQKILALRWPQTFKIRDIKKANFTRTFKGNINVYDGGEYIQTIEPIDLVSGGFPCQDISTAGKGAGITGTRSGLWKEMLRIICEVRPRYVLVENVTALLGRGLGTVLGDLAEVGYDCEWDCIPASALGAPHQRDRIWIIAYASSKSTRMEKYPNSRQEQSATKSFQSEILRQEDRESSSEGIGADCKDVAYTIGNGRSKRSKDRCGTSQARIFSQAKRKQESNSSNSGQSGSVIGKHWAVEPNVGRVAHGVAKRVDRLKLLGNGQVVQVVQWIGKRIIEFDKGNF